MLWYDDRAGNSKSTPDDRRHFSLAVRFQGLGKPLSESRACPRTATSSGSAEADRTPAELGKDSAELARDSAELQEVCRGTREEDRGAEGRPKLHIRSSKHLNTAQKCKNTVLTLHTVSNCWVQIIKNKTNGVLLKRM